ncbi:MAG: GGDEF domain-containing protein [Lachnospiraceae bacterium]|nr:GGDEF domain-containing protein [Lachnospiraceae bacterium]
MEQYSFDERVLGVLEKSCIPYAIYQMVDDRVVTIMVSDGLCDLFDISREAAVDRLNNHIYDTDHPDDVARLGDAAITFAGGGGEYDVLYRTMISGSYRIIHAQGRHVYTSKGERLAVIWYSDEGPYKDDNQSLYDQAFNSMMTSITKNFGNNYDSLTGLPNMSYFFKLAESTHDRLVAHGKEPVLIFFDFNDMKNYNLKYGFSEGDKLIHGMSQVLVEEFSNINCCRFGGDHFVAVSENESVEEKLKRIFEKVKGLNDGKTLFVRAGIYKSSMGEVSVGVASDRAKMACDTLRDRISSAYRYFNDDMLKSSRMRHYIIDNLDRALREKWVEVYYQPIVRSVNGRVCDEEALARWIDPVLGFLSPADFIPVLEDAKLLYKLDLYMLEQVIEKMKRLEEEGLHVVPHSINISRSDFEMCNIVEEIRKRVDDAGMEREKFTIEITESAIGADMDYIMQQVQVLDGLGFKVWMDDYGSGYSSPEILQRIKFSTLKLDMQFMRQFDKTEKSRIIISEIINMALNLGMETVVEGVETIEQVQFLREVGATKLQGFYFCKPIPIASILERYKSGAQIGFENPKEADYYAAIGGVNLYDISPSAKADEGITDYFDTIPMAIFEIFEEDVAIIRCNKSYQKVLKNVFAMDDPYVRMKKDVYGDGYGSDFMEALLKCGKDGGQIIEDEQTVSGRSIHMLFRRVAVNPVTDVKAVAVIMLDIRDVKKELSRLTYGSVAQALSSDYVDLFYVNVITETFVIYSPEPKRGEMMVERHGDDFFAEARKDAKKLLHKDDQDGFIEIFTKENVLNAIRENGAFTCTYRVLRDGSYIYVEMKATAMGRDKRHIIIGVNNVDARMRQQEEIDRLKEERLSFYRMSALMDDHIAFYSVDPKTEEYFAFNATRDYESLGVSQKGKGFFRSAHQDALKAVYEEDRELFINSFNMENIMSAIEEGGLFTLDYRLNMKDGVKSVRLKAVRITEDDKERLIFGVREKGS